MTNGAISTPAIVIQFQSDTVPSTLRLFLGLLGGSQAIEYINSKLVFRIFDICGYSIPL